MAKSNAELAFTPNVVSVRYFKTSTDIIAGLGYDLYKLSSTYVKIYDYDDGLTVIFKANRTNSQKVYISIDGVLKNSVRRDIELLSKEKKSLENATVLVDELYMCVYNASLDKFVLLSATERGGMQTFNTVNELKLSNSIRDGVIAVTLGQESAGDGMAAFYQVTLNPPAPTATLQPIAVQNGLYIVEIKTADSTTLTELQQVNVSNVNRLGTLEDNLGFVNRTSTALQSGMTALFNGATGYAKTLLGLTNFLHNFINTIYPTRVNTVDTRFNADENMMYEIIGKDNNNVPKVGTKTKLDLHATADKAIELDHNVTVNFLDDVTGSLTSFTGKNAAYNVSLSVKDDSHVHLAESTLQAKRNIAGATNELLQIVLNDKASTTTTNTFTQEQTFNNGIKSTNYKSMATVMNFDNTLNGNGTSIVYKIKDSSGVDTTLTMSGTGIRFGKGASNYDVTFSGSTMTLGTSIDALAVPKISASTSVSTAAAYATNYYFSANSTRLLANGTGIELRAASNSPIAYLVPTIFNLFSSNGNSLNLKANDTDITFDATSGIQTFNFTKPTVFSSSITANELYAPKVQVKKSSLTYEASIESNYVQFASSAGLNYYTFDKFGWFPSLKVGGTALAPLVTVQGSSQVELVAGTAATRFHMNKDLYVIGEVSCSSDPRLKSNIIELNKEDTLNKLFKLSAYSYNFKECTDTTIGVLADKVEEEFPQLVRYNEDGMRTVNYNGLSALSINAIGALKVELDETNRRLAAIEAKLSVLLPLGY